MCIEIYISSAHLLPIVEWDDMNRGFWLREVQEEEHFARRFLQDLFLYQVGSYMGCACGFAYGDWSKESLNENHEARIRDVHALFAYLSSQVKNGTIKLLVWDWSVESWQEVWDQGLQLGLQPIYLNPKQLPGDEFEFEDNIIYQVRG